MTIRCSLHDTGSPGSGSLVYQQDDPAQSPVQSDLTNTAEDVDFITSIVVSRDGVDIAAVSVHVPARSLVTSPDLEVKGQLTDQPGERGFLEMTWKQPTSLQSGKYRCVVDSIDMVGHSFDFSGTLDIDEEEVSVGDLVMYVQDGERERRRMNSTIGDLNREIHSLKQKSDSLESQLNKSLTNVFFSVGLDTTGSFNIGQNQVVTYNKIFANEGGAYSPVTGVFTCSVPGFYMFITTITPPNDKHAAVHLLHNGNHVINNVVVGASGSTNSVIIKLAKGDTVKVISVWGDTFSYSAGTEISTTLTGHLIDVE